MRVNRYHNSKKIKIPSPNASTPIQPQIATTSSNNIQLTKQVTSNKPLNNNKCSPITEDRAKLVLKLWKDFYEDAMLLIPPTVNIPVATITHSLPIPYLIKNGLRSLSPLANNALYSFECATRVEEEEEEDNVKCHDSDSKYLNLYEVLIPDIPGIDGSESTTQFYVRRLIEKGLLVDSVHYHWAGSTVLKNDKLVSAIHHSSSDLPPEEFSERTIQVLKEVTQLFLID